MSLVSDTIPSLLHGVSKQPDKSRFKTQLESQDNYYPSLGEGLKDRAGSEHQFKLNSSILTDYKAYTIDRDSEQYKVLLYNNDLKVYDMADGTEKSVTFPNGKEYITDSSPQTNFELFNIGDYTFVLNKNKTVAMDSSLVTEAYPNTALVFVRQGDYSTKYNIYINGSVQGTKTTAASDASDINTDQIAADLKASLEANLGTGWTVERAGSVLYIQKDDGSDFDFRVEDSNGNNNLYGFKGTADSISDLPLTAPDGYVIKIAGDAENSEDDYYVKFQVSNNASSSMDEFSQGVWIETVKPGIKYQFDASTMPHILIRNSDGTFTFQQATWGQREVGDEDTNEEPSFIGKKIKDIILFKDRLGFVLSDRVVYSRINHIFNFWKESVLTELATDPVDLAASDTNFQNIHHGIPFGELVLLFSKDKVFKNLSNDTFSYDTAYITTAMGYESANIKPVSGGKRIFFAYEVGNYTGIWEAYNVTNTDVDAIKITEHIPNYLPKNLIKMTVCNSENVLACLSSDERNSIYLYKYYYTGKEKAQSAWGRWTFTGSILDIEFLQNELSLLVQYSDGVYLEKIVLSPAYYDEPGFHICLDRKEYDPPGAYDPTTNKTTFTLSYPAPSNITVVDSRGFKLTVTDRAGNTVSVSGDKTGSAESIIIGIPYTREFEFSKFFYRDNEDNVVSLGMLQLKYLLIDYSDTGYFQVLVTPKNGTTSTYSFTGRIIGSSDLIIGAIPLMDGDFKVPINCKNEDVTIKIRNTSHLPSKFISARWIGNYSARGR